MIVIELSNGKSVGNFSSPHAFVFEDDSVLPSVTKEEAIRLQVTFNEAVDEDGDVSLSFSLSDAVLAEMEKWEKIWKSGMVNVVFCPLPMITALKEMGYDVKNSPFRSIRIEDRIEKKVSIRKQCI